jgi:hypothetical protein
LVAIGRDCGLVRDGGDGYPEHQCCCRRRRTFRRYKSDLQMGRAWLSRDGPVLRLCPEPRVDPATTIRALRQLLKTLWRRHGLKCISIKEEREQNERRN